MSKIEERHQKMLAFQQEIKPFVPTLRELATLWGDKSTSVVRYYLDKMVAAELAISRSRGKYHSYYAVTKCQ